MSEIRASDTAVLDFVPACTCGADAKAFLEMHAFACCEEEPTRAVLRCSKCLNRDLKRIISALAHSATECPTCGLTICQLSDMVVKLCPLWNEEEE